MDQIVKNASKDPSYSPYCMRCSGLIRMQKIEEFLWRCKCGAIHDSRAEAAATADTKE